MVDKLYRKPSPLGEGSSFPVPPIKGGGDFPLKNMNFLVLDTETGSRHASSTLLTAYFLVVSPEFKSLGELYFYLKPDNNEHYVVDAQGLAVNKIDIVEHDKVAITCKQAKSTLYDFLKEHSANGRRLTPLGHGVKGDIRRITDNLISIGSWDQFCTYHFIDTSVVLQYLRAINKIPMDGDGSVGAMAEYFNIKVDGELHNAKTDAILTMRIFQKMVELGKT